jgi:hypothetical protein
MDSSMPCLKATKRAHLEMRQLLSSGAGASGEDLLRWKTVVAQANRELARLARLLDHARLRHAAEMAVLHDEMRSELVDREAHAARTAERYRLALERDAPTQAATFDRARSSAAAIEAAIAELAPREMGTNSCVALAVDSSKREAGGAGRAGRAKGGAKRAEARSPQFR